jgi:hypothetical protein
MVADLDSPLALEAQLAAERKKLLAHPVYSQVTGSESLRAFMASHVFAVWDFMTLLKTLQRGLTCVDPPWSPPRDPELARIINEIVLGEETDEVTPGRCLSHFELYLEAMDEVGASMWPVQKFLAHLAAEGSPDAALKAANVSRPTQRFVRATLEMATRPLHEVAAAFFLGREDIIPDMFANLLASLDAEGLACPSFRLYLERHRVLDGDHHGPMGRRLVKSLCREDPARWQEAWGAGIRSLNERAHLWDAVCREIGATGETGLNLA